MAYKCDNTIEDNELYNVRERKKSVFEYIDYDGICFTSIQSNVMTSMNSSPYSIMRSRSINSIHNVRYYTS
jgi:hypothetical protein